MDTQSTTPIRSLQQSAASLLIYQAVLQPTAGQAFLNLLQTINQKESDRIDCLKAYGFWFHTLAAHHQSWQDYLLTQILQADNPFTRQVQQQPLSQLPASLIAAARHDLQVLQQLYQYDGTRLSQLMQTILQVPEPVVAWENIPEIHATSETAAIRSLLQGTPDWSDRLEDLALHYQRSGTGIFAQYRAFRWQAGQLIGIAHPDPVRLADLACYDLPRQRLLQNTEFLLAGYRSLHVLLYGSRGSGKSSLVKALLQEYGDRGLRLIEVAKSELQALPAIVEQLRIAPQKFIIFVDDLSFEEDEDAFKALKVVLEGTLTARPQNVVVYATSNRRHLIREFFDDRPRPSNAEEVHAWDTVQEKLSFSDRFGLTLTFEPADQNTYLQIVQHLAVQAGIDLNAEDLKFRALQWATRHNGRSGRTARQFIDFLQAELHLTPSSF